MIELTLTCDKCGAKKVAPPKAKGSTWYEFTLWDYKFYSEGINHLCEACHDELERVEQEAKSNFLKGA